MRSVLTMLNPQYSVVVPQGVQVKMPLAYPLAGDDAAWGRYVNTWIGLKRRDGFIDRLYDHWILGRSDRGAATLVDRERCAALVALDGNLVIF